MDGQALGKAFGDLVSTLLWSVGVLIAIAVLAVGSCSYFAFRPASKLDPAIYAPDGRLWPDVPLTDEEFQRLQAELRDRRKQRTNDP